MKIGPGRSSEGNDGLTPMRLVSDVEVSVVAAKADKHGADRRHYGHGADDGHGHGK